VSDPVAIQTRGLRDLLRWLGGASDGASAWEAPGVTAAIVPATAQRSIVNSVVFDSPEQLEAAYEQLDSAYGEAGVEAWSVWTPEFQTDAIELLKSRGHAFDGKPAAMTLDLERLAAPEPGDLDWDSEGTFDELGRINDEAYGLDPGSGMAAAIAAAPGDLPIRVYRARLDGETASVLATIDHDEDIGIYWVATVEQHMRRGLAGRLLGGALAEGRERGLQTSSLQSSAKGQPLYERLGYRSHFAIHLYERRR